MKFATILILSRVVILQSSSFPDFSGYFSQIA